MVYKHGMVYRGQGLIFWCLMAPENGRHDLVIKVRSPRGDEVSTHWEIGADEQLGCSDEEWNNVIEELARGMRVVPTSRVLS